MASYGRKEIERLRARWDDAALRGANEALVNGQLSSPFGQTEAGMADFRGVVLSEILREKTYERADFALMSRTWAAQFIYCRFVDCFFILGQLDINLGSSFEACNFSRANLNEAHLRGKFVGCNFEKTKCRGAVAVETTFEDCRFLGADLRRADLIRCKFLDCTADGARFGGGSLGSSYFEGGNILDQDLGDTIIDHIRRG